MTNAIIGVLLILNICYNKYNYITFTVGAVLLVIGIGFFGITVHAEKEILMLVVEKDIRDNILHALYREMGMQKKAQGIVFSLPVSEAAGLIAPEEDK